MIAYNKVWLDNLAAREDIEDAFHTNTLSAAEKKAAEMLYPVGFYSPNIFVRAGLFILTIIIACFSLGLLALMFLSGIEDNIAGLVLFIGLFSYGALEFFVQAKYHYRSGVDDALLWITAVCLVSSLNLAVDISSSTNALVIFILATYFFLRFTDMLMAAASGLALLAVIFFNYSSMGDMARSTTPFLIMAIATAIYFGVKKMALQNSMRYYRLCSVVLEITMLIGFYAAANYYVVREVSNSMFGLGLNDNESIPFGWLFWIFTITIPLLYILRGLQKKDVVLLRIGLMLVAAIVFTVRYYYTVLPMEILMVLNGAIMIAISYAVTNYLTQPKNGFTSARLNNRPDKDKLNIEALLIAETFGTTEPAADAKFGGGSTGGGGASGEF